MEAMENMLAGMLKKILPPDTLDKIGDIGKTVTDYISDSREKLTNIERTQALILEEVQNVRRKLDDRAGGTGSHSNGDATAE